MGEYLSWQGEVEASEEKEISCTVRVDTSGTVIVLPPIQIMYDSQGREHVTRTQKFQVKVKAEGTRIDPELVNREKPRDKLKEAMRAAILGEGKVVFIAGEGGIGKSKLVEYFALRAVPREVIALRGYCHDKNMAYSGIKTVLRSVFGIGENFHTAEIEDNIVDYFRRKGYPEHRSEYIEFFARFLSSESPALDTDKPGEFAGKLNSFFFGVAEKAPLLIVFEDLHHADSQTLSWILGLARIFQHVNTSFLLVGTLRPDEIDPEFHNEIKGLSGNIYTEIPLKTLNETYTEKLISQALQGFEEREKNAIFEITSGHPMFIVQILQRLFETGKIRKKEGGWELDPDVDLHETIPGTLPDIIRERLDALSRLKDGEWLGDLLNCCAVIGRQFEERLLDLTLEKSDLETKDEILRKLDGLIGSLMSTGILKESTEAVEPSIAFAHDLWFEIIYDDFRKSRRRAARKLHLAAASALQEAYSGTPEAVAGELARHYEEGGNRIDSLHYAVIAGERSADQYAYREAVYFYRKALGHLDQMKEVDQEKADVLAALARAEYMNGKLNESLKHAEECLRIIQSTDRETITQCRILIAHIRKTKGEMEKAFSDLRNYLASARANLAETQV